MYISRMQQKTTNNGFQVSANTRALYRFEGNCNDMSGNGYHGTATSMLYDAAYGKILQGIKSNASPSGVVLPNAMPGTIGTGAFTVSFWMNPKQPPTGSYPILFGTFGSSSPYNGPLIFFDPLGVSAKGDAILVRVNGENEKAILTPSASSLFNKWSMITFTRNSSGQCNIYYGATNVLSFTDNTNIPAAGYAYMCSRPTLAIQAFGSDLNAVMMDELIFENVEWSAAKIASYV